MNRTRFSNCSVVLPIVVTMLLSNGCLCTAQNALRNPSTEQIPAPVSNDTSKVSTTVRISRPAQPDYSLSAGNEMIQKAIKDLNAGNVDEAAHLLYALTEKDPLSDIAFFNLGQICARRGQIVTPCAITVSLSTCSRRIRVISTRSMIWNSVLKP